MSSIAKHFSSSDTIHGEIELFLRKADKPFKYCMSLVSLDDIEKKLADPQFADKLISHLSSREKKLFSGFTFAKRRKEWLGGRLAAKYAVVSHINQRRSIDLLADFSVLPRENGSPKIHTSLISEDKLPSLSLSHSEQFAVALVAEAKSCGIDIQKVSNRIQRVSDRFSSKKELMLLQDSIPQLSKNERLTLLWSAKEALKKSMLQDQPVIFQGVVLQSLEFDQFFTLHLQFPGVADKAAKVTVSLIEDYMLAYTIAESINA